MGSGLTVIMFFSLQIRSLCQEEGPGTASPDPALVSCSCLCC